jgi:hypothetical protein
VARAKRTARAEARRRSRAAQSFDDTEGAELSETAGEPAPLRQTSTQAQKTTAQPARMGFMVAFRAAIHPIHVREDLASLPLIATHSKALWIPLLITILSTVAIIATNGGDLSLFMFAYFIQTPAIGGVFIAGFLAPRASWLLGVVVGLVSAACYTLLLLYYPATIYSGLPPTQSQAVEVAASAFVLSPVIGGIFAAGAAWYRRFLRLSAPVRSRPTTEKKSKPGDGRTRSSGPSQKAGARR